MATTSFAAGALKSNGPSISLLDNSKISGSVGIGNFKGVMLCNRPFAGVTSMDIVLLLNATAYLTN